MKNPTKEVMNDSNDLTMLFFLLIIQLMVLNCLITKKMLVFFIESNLDYSCKLKKYCDFDCVKFFDSINT